MNGTTSITAGATAAHALIALGHHILNRHLPRPNNITLDHAANAVDVAVYSGDAETWWASLDGGIDTASATTDIGTPVGPVYERVTVNGRLPDSGVRIELHWVRPASKPLAVLA